jgi:hypothetical protein
MIFGDKKEFAVEAFHERLGEKDTHVFGRMCIWLRDEMLGDLDEPACMLDVTIGFLESILDRIAELCSKELSNLSDFETYNYLDEKLYGDDERTAAQVSEDANIYFRYDFLTNGGESFDNSKSFIVADGFFLRVLFLNYDTNKFTGHKVPILEFSNIINQFLAWYSDIKSKLISR